MRWAVAIAVSTAVLVGGCGKPVEGSPMLPDWIPVVPGKPAKGDKLNPYGYQRGQCSPLDSDTIKKVVGGFEIRQYAVGALCQWASADNDHLGHVMYAYYEGASLDRDRKAADGMGQRTQDVTIQGHKGFTYTGPLPGVACGVTIEAATGTLTWWVRYPDGNADACAASRTLVEKTLQTVL